MQRLTRKIIRDWHGINGTRRAIRTEEAKFTLRGRSGTGIKKKRNILMHREILFYAKVKNKLLVDHINGDGLDNRKSNLRTATHRQNAWNSRAYGKSKYKGIWQVRETGKWCARIKVNGKVRNLGRFSDEVEAAKAYDRAVKKCAGNLQS
jgi:hypothetical protein